MADTDGKTLLDLPQLNSLDGSEFVYLVKGLGDFRAPASLVGSANVTYGAVVSALGYVPYDATVNPSNFITVSGARSAVSGSSTVTYNVGTGTFSLTLANVTAALGYTPYSSANPAGYITAANVRTQLSATAPVVYNSGTGVIGLAAIADGTVLANTTGGSAAPAAVTFAALKAGMALNNVENKSSATIRSELTSGNVTTALGYTPASLTPLAASTGDSLVGHISDATNATATTVQLWIRMQSVVPEDFGYTGSNPTNDNLAVTRWLASLSSSRMGKLNKRPYNFTGGLSKFGNDISIEGSGESSALIYTGASTTTDLFTISDINTECSGWRMSGFKIDSTTTMTAGAAIHANLMRLSYLNDVILGGFNTGNSTGAKIFDCIWLDGMDNVYINGVDYCGRGKGVKVNCRRNATYSHGSGLFIDNGKIGGCGSWGVHVGGGFGGLYMDNMDIINNGNISTSGGLLVDQTLYARNNREVMLGNVSFDGNSQYNVYLDDATIGTGWFVATGTWFAGGAVGLYINRFGSASVQINGGTFYLNGNSGVGGVGDGVFVSGSTGATQVNLNDCDFRNNKRWAVNGPGNVIVNGGNFSANGQAAQINGGAIWKDGMQRTATSYEQFDRVNSRWLRTLNGVVVAYCDATGWHNGAP